MTNKLLVHCCCVHCSAYTLNYWREQGYDVTSFWYNPNIHPSTEHQLRLEALETLAKQENIPLLINPGYEIERYFQAVVGHEKKTDRCIYCYRIRLQAVSDYARQHGFDSFTSTLLISPKQQHERILNVALEIQQSSGINFLYADLRKRYSDGRKITKPMELYRQQYCGCLFSEWERYGKETKRE